MPGFEVTDDVEYISVIDKVLCARSHGFEFKKKFVAKALSPDLLTKVRKAKLKPELLDGNVIVCLDLIFQ